jgi:hypothetical protein
VACETFWAAVGAGHDYQSYEPAGADVVTVSRDDLQTALRYARGIDVDDDPAFDRLYAAVEAGK